MHFVVITLSLSLSLSLSLVSAVVCLCVKYSEILRVIDSLQLTATKKVATPANWTVSCMYHINLVVAIFHFVVVYS